MLSGVNLSSSYYTLRGSAISEQMSMESLQVQQKRIPRTLELDAPQLLAQFPKFVRSDLVKGSTRNQFVMNGSIVQVRAILANESWVEFRNYLTMKSSTSSINDNEALGDRGSSRRGPSFDALEEVVGLGAAVGIKKVKRDQVLYAH